MIDVLILTEDAADYTRHLPGDLEGARLHVAAGEQDLGPEARQAQVALAKPALLARVLDQLPQLRWVQSTFAGVDPLLRSGLRQDYILTGVKGVFGPLMSEYVFGQIIAVERGFAALRAAQRERRWEPRAYRGLSGLTLGVAGLGSIGQHIVATAGHFGMRVVGYRRRPGEVEGVDRVYSGEAFREFAAVPDYLVLVLPATPESHHLVNADTLDAMGAGSWLINVGRGAVVNETALAGALQARRIGGAVLDVFEDEPLAPESPLWDLDNCVVTPHVAAESFPSDIVAIFLENWRRYRAGEPLQHVIDFQRGY